MPYGIPVITGRLRFGSLDLASYLECANREVMVVVMIEDREGVEAIDAICSVAGVDMVLEGAVDLSQSYGLPAQPQHPLVQAAIQRVAAACSRHGLPFCALPRQAGQYEHWRGQGVRAFLVGDDRGIGFRALKAQRATFA